MAGNSIGIIFRLTTFGESHGTAVGGVIDGCPAGLKIDEAYIRKEVQRRRPGQSFLTSQRDEEDKVEFLSGIFKGYSTGAPIAFLIKNKDHRSSDYDHLKDVYRPSHADYTYFSKYGIRDHRGGGRSSARETVSRVVGGAVAKQILLNNKIKIQAFVSQVGNIKLLKDYKRLDFSLIEDSLVRCPDPLVAAAIQKKIEKISKQGDSIGGVITCVISGMPVGLGEPVFNKLNADLASAVMSINAVKGFELGSGFKSAEMRGSEHNDAMVPSRSKGNKVKMLSNYSGGIQGGISNGEDIVFRVAFKPVSTIAMPQQTVSSKNKKIQLNAHGRHDACVVPRAVPIVEAMAAIVIADHLLRSRSAKL